MADLLKDVAAFFTHYADLLNFLNWLMLFWAIRRVDAKVSRLHDLQFPPFPKGR
jgi:hypothetical protein